MNAAELERIRRKVEQGEALTSEELARLSDAARAQPGPTLRLAVAHAMMNGGEERTALPLLEALVRDFPRDLQGWLGLARALLSLERTREAERALREALRLSPGDPEAQKAMATLAMGRGELARARQWVADVLRRDPFDAEARLIRQELEAADTSLPVTEAGQGQQYALRPEFTRALVSALRGRGVAVSVQGDALFLKSPRGELGRADLRSLYSAYLAGDRALAEYVAGAAHGLIAAAHGVPGGRDELLARVRPVLRAGGFSGIARGACFREGPAGLAIFYVLEDPEYVRYLPAGLLDAHGLSLEEVDRAAFAALEAAPAPVRAVQVLSGRLLAAVSASGVWAVSAEDGHDAARLLTVAQRARLQETLGPGPWRVDLGRREVALVSPPDDEAAARQLRALQPEEDGLPGQFLLTADGALMRVAEGDAPSR
jgi:hypothetical protein